MAISVSHDKIIKALDVSDGNGSRIIKETVWGKISKVKNSFMNVS